MLEDDYITILFKSSKCILGDCGSNPNRKWSQSY